MGQYKFYIVFKIQIGFLISYYRGFELTIELPFIEIIIGLTKESHGYNIFNRIIK